MSRISLIETELETTENNIGQHTSEIILSHLLFNLQERTSIMS